VPLVGIFIAAVFIKIATLIIKIAAVIIKMDYAKTLHPSSIRAECR
jgi:hypothetical protein